MSVLIFENLEFLTFILTEQIVDIYEHCQGVIFPNYLYSRLQNFVKFFSPRKFLKKLAFYFSGEIENFRLIFSPKFSGLDLTNIFKIPDFPEVNENK